MATKATKPFAVKGINVTSPKGKAMWCKITEPERTYNADGVLSTNLVCDPEDPTVKAFVEKLEELRDIALAETKETLGAKGAQYKAKSVFNEEFDKEGEATGNIVFKFALKDIDKRKEAGHQSTIMVVDTKKQKVSPVPLVGNGSAIRCVAYANPYTMANTKEVGISLIWSKMQLIELVKYAGGGADDFDEEEGFEAAPAAATADEFSDVDF